MSTPFINYWETDRIGRGLKLWQRERPDLDSSGKAIVGRVLNLHEIFIARINRNLAPLGLRYPAYAVLATLRVSGAPYQMSPSELLDLVVLTSGGLSNLLRKLEQEGVIERKADDRDGRGVIVQLTAAGIELADQAMTRHAALERDLTASLSPESRDAIGKALSALIVANP